MIKILIPRKTFVIVKKVSRGRFPGRKSEVGETGVVWSRWNSKFGTEKISILSKDLTISFTSSACVSIVEVIEDEDAFEDMYIRWAEANHIPIVIQVVDIRLIQPDIQKKQAKNNKKYKHPGAINIQKAKTVKCKSLAGKELYLKQSYCHPLDWSNMIEGIFEGKKVFCIRVEPWILEKNNII